MEALHLMTNFKTYQLRADMLDWDEHSQYALYASIQVADAGDFYKLTVGSKSGGEAGKRAGVCENVCKRGRIKVCLCVWCK